jgi:HK97 gp10 family phage protein
MGFIVTQDTMTLRLKQMHSRFIPAFKTGIERSLETIRSKTLAEADFPVKTGRLRNSIQGSDDSIYSVETSNSSIKGTVGTNVPYAVFVEFGTSRMAPRYYFTAGFEGAKPLVYAILQKSLSEVLNA